MKRPLPTMVPGPGVPLCRTSRLDRIVEWVLFVMVAVAALAAVVMLGVALFAAVGCSAAPRSPIVTEKLVQVPVFQRCARQPPPADLPAVGRPRCIPDPKCGPATTEMAWSKADFATLVVNVQTLKAWIANIWTLCAPTPTTAPSRRMP